MKESHFAADLPAGYDPATGTVPIVGSAKTAKSRRYGANGVRSFFRTGRFRSTT